VRHAPVISVGRLSSLETVFHAIRVARQAEIELDAQQQSRRKRRGAVADFSTVFPTLRSESGPEVTVVATNVDLEPGTVLRKGTHPVSWSVSYASQFGQWDATGTFWIVVGPAPKDLPDPVATFRDSKRPAPPHPDVDVLPTNVHLDLCDHDEATKTLRRLVRAGDRALNHGLWAEDTVQYTLTKARKKADGRYRHGSGAFGPEDTDAVMKMAICTGANKFASNERPNCTWLRWLEVNTHRQGVRAYFHMLPESTETETIRSFIRGNNLTELTAEQVRQAHAENLARKQWLKQNPGRSLADADTVVGSTVVCPSRSPWTLTQISKALAVPVSFLELARSSDDSGEPIDRIADSVDVADLGSSPDVVELIAALHSSTGVDAAELIAWLVDKDHFTLSEFPDELAAKAKVLMYLGRAAHMDVPMWRLDPGERGRIDRAIYERCLMPGETWDNQSDKQRAKNRMRTLIFDRGSLRSSIEINDIFRSMRVDGHRLEEAM
jgi:hypothetical protein